MPVALAAVSTALVIVPLFALFWRRRANVPVRDLPMWLLSFVLVALGLFGVLYALFTGTITPLSLPNTFWLLLSAGLFLVPPVVIAIADARQRRTGAGTDDNAR